MLDTLTPRPYQHVAPLHIGSVCRIDKALCAVSGAAPRAVAIKQLVSSERSNDSALSLFEQECQLALRLHHPNLVRTIHIGVQPSGPYLVMELVRGTTIAQMLRTSSHTNTPMPAEVCVSLCCQLLDALAYVHGFCSAGDGYTDLVHGDVSPSNVLVTGTGCAQLCDFGCTRQRLGPENYWQGKPGYMSPEQIRGEALDPRSDLFCCAVVLAEMLIARPLFRRSTRRETLVANVSADLTVLLRRKHMVPAPVLSILIKALALRPGQRHDTTTALARELRAITYSTSPLSE